jgi:hypothetical protein
MTYQLSNLNVASLDFDDIKTSLISFLRSQPDLADIDFDNDASAANLLINILATATAYNGVYAQFGFVNSFATTTTLLNSLLGIAANNSILLAPVQSATSTRTITASGATLASYTTFRAITPSGAQTYFYNIEQVPNNTSKSITLYDGSNVVSYTNYDYTTQSCQLPYNVDPRTITFYENVSGTTLVNQWTRVDKGTTSITDNNKTFTVINGPQGYIVTNNFLTSQTITTSSTVLIKAVTSNGNLGNEATISPATNTIFATSESSFGGYNLISVTQARYKLLFNATGQDRCVTINDYVNAILSSGISGTSDITKITVQADCCIPGKVKIYVDGLSSAGQAQLLLYLQPKIIVGTNLSYEQ